MQGAVIECDISLIMRLSLGIGVGISLITRLSLGIGVGLTILRLGLKPVFGLGLTLGFTCGWLGIGGG